MNSVFDSSKSQRIAHQGSSYNPTSKGEQMLHTPFLSSSPSYATSRKKWHWLSKPFGSVKSCRLNSITDDLEGHECSTIKYPALGPLGNKWSTGQSPKEIVEGEILDPHFSRTTLCEKGKTGIVDISPIYVGPFFHAHSISSINVHSNQVESKKELQ